MAHPLFHNGELHWQRVSLWDTLTLVGSMMRRIVTPVLILSCLYLPLYLDFHLGVHLFLCLDLDFISVGMMMGLGKRAPHSISEGGKELIWFSFSHPILLFTTPSFIFTSFFYIHLIFSPRSFLFTSISKSKTKRGCAALQEWWWALAKGLHTLFLKEVKN